MDLDNLSLGQLLDLTPEVINVTEIESDLASGPRGFFFDWSNPSFKSPFAVFYIKASGLQGRVQLSNGAVAKLSDINTIWYEIYNMKEAVLLNEGFLEPDDILFETLQEWEEDEIGYNFSWNLSGISYPTEGLFRIILYFSPVDAVSFIRIHTSTTI